MNDSGVFSNDTLKYLILRMYVSVQRKQNVPAMDGNVCKRVLVEEDFGGTVL